MMFRTLLFSVMCFAVALVGCSEDSTQAQQAAPPLPPLASMQVGVGVFDGANGSKLPALLDQVPATSFHFLNAAVRVTLVNVALLTALAPPTAAVAAALNTIPSRDGDGYLWIYTWNAGESDHQIRLHGEPQGEVIDWEVYLSLFDAEPELWFYGQSQNGRESMEDPDKGFWIFKAIFQEQSPDQDREIVRIDWVYESEGHGSLEITNLDAEAQGYLDELLYTLADPSAAITFYDISEDVTWDVAWNGDGSGSIKAPGYNQGERGCWDTEQQDAPCPMP